MTIASSDNDVWKDVDLGKITHKNLNKSTIIQNY